MVFTALGETLSGNISVDTISSLDLYLLSGTTYTGAMTISENSVNTSAADAPITVNLSADSTWVVTGNSTVTDLNIASGAKIVDASGKTVTVVAGGKTVVTGDSQYTVTVTGSCGTTVAVSDANALSTDFIDRSDFDSCYAVTTSFGTNGSAASSSSGGTAAAASDTSAASADTSDGHAVLYAALSAAVLLAAVVLAVKRGHGKGGSSSK